MKGKIKMKRFLTLVLALLMIVSLAACSAENGKITDASEDTSAESTVDTTEDTTASEGKPEVETTESKPDAETNDVAISAVVDGIKNAMGENYLPNMDIDAEILAATYGVNAEWVEEFVAQVPMISFNIDTLIAVKAKDGNAADVEKALNDYLTYQIENSMQYPVNVPKLEASRVYRVGNYVFYICLGIIPEELIDDEAGAYKTAVENNEAVISKIDELLVK